GRHLHPDARWRRKRALYAGQRGDAGHAVGGRHARLYAGHRTRGCDDRHQSHQPQSALMPSQREQHGHRQLASTVRRRVLRQHGQAARVDRHRRQLELAVRAFPHQFRLSASQGKGRRYQALLLQRRNLVLMKARILGATMLALSALVATPAAAQVNGVAVTDPAVVIAGSQALQTAYTQISTTFQAQRTQLEQLQQQRATAIRQFDTNGDGQLSQEEQTAAQANTAVITQVQGLDQQINTIQQPITLARVYVAEQPAQQLSPAVQAVVQANNIQLILNPAATLYIAQAVDVTDDIVAQLNTLAPTVSTAVPEGWQPQQQSAQLFQQVQEILVTAAAQQQAAQQQQQQ